MKEFPTEKHFKDAVAEALSDAGCSFVREFSIGNRRAECIGNAAFADFVGTAKGGLKFFVEAKNCTIGAEMARAVGQCLLYRHLRPNYRAFIVVPSIGGRRKMNPLPPTDPYRVARKQIEPTGGEMNESH